MLNGMQPLSEKRAKGMLYVYEDLQVHIVTCTNTGFVGLCNWYSRNIGKTQNKEEDLRNRMTLMYKACFSLATFVIFAFMWSQTKRTSKPIDSI